MSTISHLEGLGLLCPRPQYPLNPQAEEIARLKKEYKEGGDSEWLKAQRKHYADGWKGLVVAHQAGLIPTEAEYGGHIGLVPVLPTEAAMMGNAEAADEWEDMQQYIRSRLRFQEGNLFFKLETANPKTTDDHDRGYRMATRSFAVVEVLDEGLEGKALEDLEDWKEFLANTLKPTFYGRTWAEIEADPPDCVDSIKLAGTLVFVTRSDAKHVRQCAFEVYVGDPRALDSWML